MWSSIQKLLLQKKVKYARELNLESDFFPPIILYKNDSFTKNKMLQLLAKSVCAGFAFLEGSPASKWATPSALYERLPPFHNILYLQHIVNHSLTLLGHQTCRMLWHRAKTKWRSMTKLALTFISYVNSKERVLCYNGAHLRLCQKSIIITKYLFQSKSTILKNRNLC